VVNSALFSKIRFNRSNIRGPQATVAVRMREYESWCPPDRDGATVTGTVEGAILPYSVKALLATISQINYFYPSLPLSLSCRVFFRLVWVHIRTCIISSTFLQTNFSVRSAVVALLTLKYDQLLGKTLRHHASL
jgi:hypothetical protein